MSYSDKAKKFLRSKFAIVPQDSEAYMFDSFSQSWKKIGVFNNQGSISTDENGIISDIISKVNTKNHTSQILL